MKPFLLHELARRELFEAASFYDNERSGLGERWLAAFNATARKIRNNPETGRPYRSATRQCRVTGFPYIIVFQDRVGEIFIVAVAHLRRRPGYWIDRLEDSES